MREVFRNFLENPKRFYLNANPGSALDDTLDSYVPYNLSPKFDKNLLRWHVVVFVSEYILDARFINANFGPCASTLSGLNSAFIGKTEKMTIADTTDFLNRKGRKLYKYLKCKYP